MAEILSLAAGSLLGGFGRHFLGGAIQRLAGGSFPYGTLLINLAGCFIIGLLHSLASSKLSLSANAKMLLIVGFCGAFTTFSTFILETSAAMDQGRHVQALSYLLVSVLLGFACFRIGIQARHLIPFLSPLS
ncbi:MAG: fluoride efflux transporter CrcB [Elusimicrobiota bacterium]